MKKNRLYFLQKQGLPFQNVDACSIPLRQSPFGLFRLIEQRGLGWWGKVVKAQAVGRTKRQCDLAIKINAAKPVIAGDSQHASLGAKNACRRAVCGCSTGDHVAAQGTNEGRRSGDCPRRVHCSGQGVAAPSCRRRRDREAEEASGLHRQAVHALRVTYDDAD